MGRRAWTRTGALASGLVWLAATAAAAAEPTVSFQIAPQPLQGALLAYGRATNQPILFSGADLGALRSEGLQGQYAPAEALERILAGADLSWRRTPTGAILVERRGDARPQATAAAARAESEVLEEVVVTGSHIRGAPASAPLSIIGRRDFDARPYADAGQALRDNPANYSGGLNGENSAGDVAVDGASSNRNYASSANLRGLGPGATLVLLNGNRLPVAGQGIAPDLSMIPAAAIERIEVLAEGASAVYGADAVAGVVNIITRRAYDGVEARVRYGGAQGGLQTLGASLMTGFRAGDFSGVLGVDRLDQSKLMATERSRSLLRGRPSTLFPEISRSAYFASGRYGVSDALELVADAGYMQRLVWDDVATAPNGLTRSTTARKMSQASLAVGAIYRTASDWTLEVHAAGHESLSKIDSASGLVATPSFIPLRYESQLRAAEARGSGRLFEAPGGSAQAALGLAYRREDAFIRGQSGVIDLSRQVWSGFAELNLPLIAQANAHPLARELLVSLALRYDDYSDFGGQTAPKVGLHWKPITDLTLSAVYSQSFRAPSTFDRTVEYAGIIRDARDNTPSGVSRTLLLLGNGRPVEPETSVNINVSAVYAPAAVTGLKLSATWYDITYDNRIALPDPPGRFNSDIRGAPAIQILRAPSPALVAQLLAGAYAVQTRGGVSADPSLITVINDSRPVNVSSTDMTGLQLAAAYDLDWAGGELGLFLDAVHLIDFTDRLGPVTAQRADTIFSPADWRGRLGARWSRGDWAATAQANYVDDYVDNRVAAAPAKVKAWATLDASLSYSFGAAASGRAGTRLTLSATNLLDTPPPLTAPTTLNRTQWDPTNASIVGRFVNLELVKTW